MDFDSFKIFFAGLIFAGFLVSSALQFAISRAKSTLVCAHKTELVKLTLAEMDVRAKSIEKHGEDESGEERWVDFVFQGIAGDGQSVAGDARVWTADNKVEITFALGYVPAPMPTPAVIRAPEATTAQRLENFLAATPEPPRVSTSAPITTVTAENDRAREPTIRAEINRRLANLQEDRGAFLANDRDGDGKVDSEEWDRVRARIEAEVRREFAAAKTSPAPEDQLVLVDNDGGNQW